VPPVYFAEHIFGAWRCVCYARWYRSTGHAFSLALIIGAVRKRGYDLERMQQTLLRQGNALEVVLGPDSQATWRLLSRGVITAEIVEYQYRQ